VWIPVLAAAVALALQPAAVSGGRPPYHNPTVGAQIALQIPGMHRAAVRRNVVYARRAGTALLLDVYRPHGVPLTTRLPGVLLVHGSTSDPSPKDWGIYVGWGQLLAASGIAAVTFNHLGSPADVRAALATVKRRAAELGVDGRRICIASFSLGVPTGQQVARTDGHVRCALIFYGPPDASLLRAGSPPTLIAEAGRDDPSINQAIGTYLDRAHGLGADVRLLVHPRGQHGFDALDHDARTREILRAAIRFVQQHLR
jgi:dienelactone hydrolase